MVRDARRRTVRARVDECGCVWSYVVLHGNRKRRIVKLDEKEVSRLTLPTLIWRYRYRT